MKTISRKELRETIESKGITASLGIPRSAGLTKKQKNFVQGIVVEGLNASDAYRKAYNTKGKPATVNPNASRLVKNSKVQATMQALEEAQALNASLSAEALKSLIISTLVDVATNSDKDSVRVASVKVLGTVVGIDLFRETKRVEKIEDSGVIRSQILDQLKSMMLSSDDAVDVDASDLLTELVGRNSDSDDPTHGAPPQNENGTPRQAEHTIPLEPSQSFLEDPPLPLETPTPQGDIFLENEK
jgi:hypothetical protein